MEKSIKSLALKYGLYLGVFLILATVILYVVNIEMLVKWYIGVFFFLVIIIVGIMSAVKSRSLLKGFITFKQAFTSYFFTVAIAILISTVFSILLFNIVDPEASEVLQEKIIESSTEMMESFGAPQSEIEKAVAEMKGQSQFSFMNQLKSIAWQLLIYAIIGLLVALGVKKSDPNTA